MPIYASPPSPSALSAEANGGFPEPPPGVRVRVVSARHDACGERTRVRLPERLPARVVRRVVCGGCSRGFEIALARDEGLDATRRDTAPRREPVAPVQPVLEPILPLEPARVFDREVEAATPPRRRLPTLRLPTMALPKRPRLSLPNPNSRGWRIASVPIAAAAVLATMLLIQGSGDETAPTRSEADGATSRAAGAKGADRAGPASFVNESNFSLAIPPGWERTSPAAGATFAATAPDGQADATLWVEEDPQLDFPTFEARSLQQLRAIAGSADVTERIAAPTPAATVVRLAADAPQGGPQYEVTLRVAGPYRYYLATTVQAGAPGEAVEGAELVHGSFTPERGTTERSAK